MQSTPLPCVCTRCRTSLVHTTVLHSYMRRVCRHYCWLHSYVLLVCRQHRRPAFVRVTKPHCYPVLSYIGTCCSSADYIVDLRSYALQNLVGTHRCPTFVHAARLPSLPLATFVRAAPLPSTSSTCVRMRCKTSLLPTAVLHSYVLLVCHLNRRPTFVRVAEARWYPLLSYIHTRCSYTDNTADLRSYALQNLVGTHCCPTFLHATRLPPLLLATFVRAARLPSTSSTCVRTRCKTSLLPTAVLHSYVLLVSRLHRRPAFVRVAEPRRYARLSYIRTCCASAAITAGYIHTCSSSAVNIVDLRSYALQNLVGTHGCPTFVHAARLPPLPLATFVHAPRLPSTSSTCVRTRCRTSSVRTAVLHSYMLRVCRHYHWLHSYVLLVCRLHRRTAFVRVAEARWYPLLSYIRTRCSYAVNTADLRSYTLRNLIGTHGFPTFVHAERLPPLPLATFVRTPSLPSTSSTCVRTHCRTSLVHTAAVHSYTLHICRHYCWLHSYVLLVCHQHHRPAFVPVAEPRWYTPLSYIRTGCTCATITAGYLRTCCSSAVYIVDLRSYALQKLIGTHCSPTFVRAARMQSTPLTCVRTHCRTSSLRTAVLHSYMLRVCRHYRWLHSYVLLVCRQHRRPAFVRIAEPRRYARLSYIRTCCVSAAITAGYIRTCCSSAVYIVDLRSYALQKLIGTHCSPTFVRAARMQSTPLTCVRTHCRTSLVHTTVLHWYMRRVCRHYWWLHSYVLLVCRQHRRPAFVRVAKPRCYPLQSYIRTCCSSPDYIVDLRSYALQNLVGTHGCPTFVHAARLAPLPLATFVRAPRLPSTSSTCVRTRCGTSSVRTAFLHSYMLSVCRHYRWPHSYVPLVCRQHRRPAFVRIAEPRWYTLLPYIRTRCTSVAITAGYIRTCSSSAVNIVDLRSYVLQNLVGTHRCRTFVHAARLPPLQLATYLRAARLPSTSSTCVRTRCRSSLVPTALLHSYALLVCSQHHRPVFVRVAEPRCYPLLSYIGTYSSSAVNIIDLRSYALQNLVATHCCPTLVRAPRLPSTLSTCVRTRCKTSLLPTAILHSYALLFSCQHRRPAFVRFAKPRCYPLLSYIGTCSSSAIDIIDLHSYALQNLVGTHRCRTFVHAARLPPLPLATFVRTARLPSTSSTCVRTRCKTSLLPTAVLHSYVLLVCHLHRRPAFVLIAEARWYPLLSYIRTRCSYAVNTTDLRSYALRNLVGTHGCPTFVHAAHLPPLPLSTFVRAARLPSTSLTCVRTCCRTSLVHTAVLHSYTLRVCRYCRWLHM